MVDINFGAIFDEVSALSDQKRIVAEEGVKIANAESQRVADSAAGVARVARSTLDQTNQLEAARVESARLAGSGSMFDMFDLIGRQVLDPQNYTREGRGVRRQEMAANLSMNEAVHSSITQSAQANVAAAESKIKGFEVMQNMAMEKVNTQTNIMQAQLQNLTVNEQLRAAQIARLQLPDLQQALAASPDANGKIKLNGLEYTPTEIRERTKALQTRERLAMLSPMVTDPDYRAKKGIHFEQILQTMNGDELRQIRGNGGFMPGETDQIPPQLLDLAIERDNARQADELSVLQNRNTVRNFLGGEIVSAGANIQRIEKSLPQDSNLRPAFGAYKVAAGELARIAEDPRLTETQKAAALDLYQKQVSQFYKAADTEATRKAGSDKDLKDIYYSQLIGGEPNPTQVREVISNRLADGKPISNVLSDKQAQRLRKLYDDKFNALKMKEAVAGGPGGFNNPSPNFSDKDMRRMAADEAMNSLAIELATDQANRMQIDAAKIPGHPLSSMPGGQIDGIMKQATQTSLEQIKSIYSLSDTEAQKVSRGEGIPGKANINEIQQAYRDKAFEAEFIAYEKIQPGLGVAVADWYQMNGADYMQRQLAGVDPTIRPLVSDYAGGSVNEMVSGWSSAKERATQMGAKNAAEFLTSSQDPVFINALTLQGDPNMSDSERALVMDEVIRPAIQAVSAMNLDPAKTMTEIEKAIQNVKPAREEVKAALKKHLMTRNTIQSNFSMMRDEIVIQNARKNKLGSQTQYPIGKVGPVADMPFAANSLLKWAYAPREKN